MTLLSSTALTIDARSLTGPRGRLGAPSNGAPFALPGEAGSDGNTSDFSALVARLQGKTGREEESGTADKDGSEQSSSVASFDVVAIPSFAAITPPPVALNVATVTPTPEPTIASAAPPATRLDGSAVTMAAPSPSAVVASGAPPASFADMLAAAPSTGTVSGGAPAASAMPNPIDRAFQAAPAPSASTVAGDENATMPVVSALQTASDDGAASENTSANTRYAQMAAVTAQADPEQVRPGRASRRGDPSNASIAATAEVGKAAPAQPVEIVDSTSFADPSVGRPTPAVARNNPEGTQSDAADAVAMADDAATSAQAGATAETSSPPVKAGPRTTNAAMRIATAVDAVAGSEARHIANSQQLQSDPALTIATAGERIGATDKDTAQRPGTMDFTLQPARDILQSLPPMVQTQIALSTDGTALSVQPAGTAQALDAQVIDMGVSGQWIDRVAREITNLAEGSGNSRFTLMPPHLGRIEISLTQRDAATAVHFATETDEAADRIRSAQSAFQADARLSSLSIGTITVEKSQQSFDQATRDSTAWNQAGRQNADNGAQAGTHSQSGGQAFSSRDNKGSGRGAVNHLQEAPDGVGRTMSADNPGVRFA